MTKSENKYKHLTRKQKYFADSVNKGHDENHGAKIMNLSIGCIDKGTFLRIIKT